MTMRLHSPAVVTTPAVAPSSFSQRRLWLLDQLYGQRATYNIPNTYRLTGPLDAARLQCSLNTVVRRHEVLRTVYAADRLVAELTGP